MSQCHSFSVTSVSQCHWLCWVVSLYLVWPAWTGGRGLSRRRRDRRGAWPRCPHWQCRATSGRPAQSSGETPHSPSSPRAPPRLSPGPPGGSPAGPPPASSAGWSVASSASRPPHQPRQPPRPAYWPAVTSATWTWTSPRLWEHPRLSQQQCLMFWCSDVLVFWCYITALHCCTTDWVLPAWPGPHWPDTILGREGWLHSPVLIRDFTVYLGSASICTPDSQTVRQSDSQTVIRPTLTSRPSVPSSSPTEQYSGQAGICPFLQSGPLLSWYVSRD